jgi:hypothetical protein
LVVPLTVDDQFSLPATSVTELPTTGATHVEAGKLLLDGLDVAILNLGASALSRPGPRRWPGIDHQQVAAEAGNLVGRPSAWRRCPASPW